MRARLGEAAKAEKKKKRYTERTQDFGGHRKILFFDPNFLKWFNGIWVKLALNTTFKC
jgi:hypothetical protein|tara:strand:- start:1007 stop:1180 length:174 start_codon:yes stop_codon:yes gene_type:complete